MTASDIAPVSPTEIRPHSRRTLALSLILLVLAAAVLFFAGLGRLPLIEPDEGRNAEVGREMMVSGDWVTPHFNGFVYLDKPAVYFWMVAASMKAFGVSEGAARLPSALMGLGTVLFAWFLAYRMFGNSVGLRAGLAFATCPLALVLSREVIFDTTLTFLVTLAMVAFWLAEEKNFQVVWFDLLMFAAMGLAVITKGFVGILIPLIAVVLYEALRGRAREWLRLRWGWGLLIFFAAALPWFITVSVRNPDFLRYALWNESFKRFATGSSHRGGGIFYYVPVFLGGFFPWSLFLLFVGWHRLRRWRELRQESGRPVLFLLNWAGWVFVFFSLSHSKLPAYFLPAIVPLSILVGLAWHDVGKEGQERSPDWLTAGFALLLGAGVLIAATSQSWLFTRWHASLAKKLAPGVLNLVQPSLLYAGVLLAALGFLGRRLAAKTRGGMAAVVSFALAAAAVPMVVLRCYQPLKLYAESHSSRRLAAGILASPERDAPIFGYYYFRTSLPFYLQRPVGLVSVYWGEMTSNYQVAHQAKARSRGERDPGHGLLITGNELQSLCKSTSQPILVVTPNALVDTLWGALGRIEPLWSESDYSIWEVPPAPEVHRESTPKETPGAVPYSPP